MIERFIASIIPWILPLLLLASFLVNTKEKLPSKKGNRSTREKKSSPPVSNDIEQVPKNNLSGPVDASIVTVKDE